MKKMMFSALACVAFAFSGFASNEVVSDITNVNLTKEITFEKKIDFEINFEADEKPCSFKVTFKDGLGNNVDFIFSESRLSFAGCHGNFAAFLDYLNKKNYEIVDIEFNWGDKK